MKKLLSIEKKAKYREGVEARKQERTRIKKVKEFSTKQDIPLNSKFQFPIQRPFPSKLLGMRTYIFHRAC
jgi:hypothetical protein